MKFKKILLSLLICLSCFVQAKNITISRLTCEMQEGLVVVEGSPRLGWVMESPENGTRQSAYEIDIREAFTGRSVWNSGKVYSSQSQLVSTKGQIYVLITHLIIVGAFVFGMKQIHLPSGAVKRNSGQYPKDYLRGSGLELLPDKMLIYRKGVSSTVES